MRIVRLLGVVLTILTAGLLLAPPAGAQPPSKLTDHITDSGGVLTDSGRAAVSTAIDRLYHDRHIQLWVVYVDNYSRFKPDNWAAQTRSASGMGDHDALLAVATNTKLYSFSPPPNVLTPDELNSLQSNKIEPAVGAKDWSGAAVAAADALDKPASSSPSSSKRIWVLIAIGVAVVVAVLVVVLVLYRRRGRRHAGQANIEARDHSLGQALSTADVRLRQISDYVARHHESIGAQAQTRFAEAKRYLAAAHSKQATNEREAIAYANGASRLAAQAQTLANSDVLAAHRTPRRGGTASQR
ncbi:MAG: TPM domain-containing protein [Mycobacterium sp.]